MWKYYYVCPRCGRIWRRYLPRRKMKCSFCATVWRTRKARGTRVVFSLKALFLWLIWFAVILFGAARLIQYLNAPPENNPTANVQNGGIGIEAGIGAEEATDVVLTSAQVDETSADLDSAPNAAQESSDAVEPSKNEPINKETPNETSNSTVFDDDYYRNSGNLDFRSSKKGGNASKEIKDESASEKKSDANDSNDEFRLDLNI